MSTKQPRPLEENLEPSNPESGQAVIGLILIFATVTLAGLALAIDFGNLWFHRQATQTAADAACQAGAMDMLGTTSGMSLNSKGFTVGSSGDCASSPTASMCVYAGFNGYNGTGPQPATNTSSEWNTVAWTFPSTVSGVTAPPSSVTSNPYLKVTVTERVKTFFVGLFRGSNYFAVSSDCTCGLAQVKQAAPIVVLHPTMSGALKYSGGAIMKIVGGPQRSIQVNSTSSTAVVCSPSGYIDTSAAGPNFSGGDVGLASTETQAQNGCSGGMRGYTGGTTGNWRSSVFPISDPYASVSAPNSVKNTPVTPATYDASKKTYYKWVGYGIDGCPDHDAPAWGGQGVATNCAEFAPGYYPNGIPLPNNYSTIIFLPGVYYVNGSLSPGGSNTIRVALPCWSSYTSGYSASACSPTASANGLIYTSTQGVMFYFTNAGTFTVGGGSSGDNIDKVPPSTLTCDGSAPSSSLGMTSSVGGNVLWAQCTQNGTYWDAGADTSDSLNAAGSRGLLFFQDHADTKSPTLSGGGQLAYAGSLYFHSTTYADVLSLSGGTGTGSYILGNIVTDQLVLSGSGQIAMQLNANPSTYMLKTGVFQ